MLKYYLVLGIPFPSTDEEIRQAYISRVKRFAPERHPKEFGEISEAYEALKSEEHRIRTAFLGFFSAHDPEDDILALGRISCLHGGQVGLRDLMGAERKGVGS